MVHEVHVNVYSMSPINEYISCLGLGIYHSGVEVFGNEYAYGGHPYDLPGIFSNAPRKAPGQGILFERSIFVGSTDLSPDEFLGVLAEMASFYKGNRYHLLQRNCNHFTQDLVWRLTRQRTPAWINRLASLAIAVHCCLPRSWVPPLESPETTRAEGSDVYQETTLLHPPTIMPSSESLSDSENEAMSLLLDRSHQQSFTLPSGTVAPSSFGIVNGGERRRTQPASPSPIPAVVPSHPPGKAQRYEVR